MVVRRCATWNVLTDHYLSYGSYGHVPQQLLLPGARMPYVLDVIAGLNADIVGIQEADLALVAAFDATGEWQIFWSPKGDDCLDGCLMLVKRGVAISNSWSRFYSDDSGYVAQSVIVDGCDYVNTHLKWPPDTHGIVQASELLGWISQSEATVAMMDCNDRPNGPVRALFDKAGFVNTCGTMPTAFIDGKLAALDLLTARGVRAEYVETGFDPMGIPNGICPSDHIPVVANIVTN